jgi:hypothetical protein
MNTKTIEMQLRTEMNTLSTAELKKFAADMGVDVQPGMTRVEIEDECIFVELYAFTH